jgi:hypothetical protein
MFDNQLIITTRFISGPVREGLATRRRLTRGAIRVVVTAATE